MCSCCRRNHLGAAPTTQSLESQLQTRRQRELDLEQQVAELTARVAQLSSSVHSAEAASKQSSNMERQVSTKTESVVVRTCHQHSLHLQPHCPHACTLVLPLHTLLCFFPPNFLQTVPAPQVARLEAALRVSSVEKQQLQQRLQQQLEEGDTLKEESGREADGLKVQLAAKDVLHR